MACDSYHRYEEDLDLVAGLAPAGTASRSPGRGSCPTGTGRGRDRAAWTTTTGSSTRRWRAGSRRPRRSTTGTCRRRSRTAAAGSNRDTAEAFADYAAVVHDRLGDRVQRLGHPQRAVVRGLPRLRRRRARAGPARGRRRPPGRPPPPARPRPGRRAAPRGRRRPTWASCSTWRRSGPRRPEADAAADRRPRRVRNRVWLGPLVDGAYDDGLLAVAPELADPGAGPRRRPRPGPRLGRLARASTTTRRSARRPADAERRRAPRGRGLPRRRRRCRSWSVSRAPTSAGRSTRPGSRSSWSTPTAHRPAAPGHRERRGLPRRRARPGRCGHRRRPGPDRLPARPHRRHRAGAGGRGRRPRLHRLDPAGQLRVGRGLHQDLRHRARRSAGPDPDAQGVLPLARRAHRTTRGRPGGQPLTLPASRPRTK